MVSTRTLGKVALVGAFVVCGSGILIQKQIRRNFCRQDFYKQSLDVLNNYPVGADILGKPIEILKVDLADTGNNWTDGMKAKVAIPMQGKRHKGILHTWSERTEEKIWRVEKADLEIQNKQWTFYIHPEARDRFTPTGQTPADHLHTTSNSEIESSTKDNEFLYLETKS